MKHLTAEQVEELAVQLDRVLRKLEPDEAMRPVALDQSAVGRLSRIDALQNQGLTRNLQEREQAKLGQVTSALRRMRDGTYGVCGMCGRHTGRTPSGLSRNANLHGVCILAPWIPGPLTTSLIPFPGGHHVG